MKRYVKNMVAVHVVILFIVLATTPLMVSGNLLKPESINDTQKELVLLRGEHYFVLKASDDVDSFNVKYSFPPDYLYQVPILFELLNDTTANTILNYSIENHTTPPNKVVNFTLASMEKDESVTLHFYYWVLVKNHDYKDLPYYVKIPTKDELPEETKTWLVSTDVVQADSTLIKLKARQLRGFNNNLRTLAYKTAKFTRLHRYLFFIIQLNLGTFKSQDALTTLFRNGECPGRSHLGCALFRANNVPARVIMATPHYDFWYQTHFMTEYYSPEYGWVLTEVHKGITPYEPKHQIIMRICYPEDENDTRTDYFFQEMTGLERFYWIENDDVDAYYVDFIEGSRSNMFIEKEISTESQTAEDAFDITKNVFNLYQQYLGSNLIGENLLHFQNATTYQKNAINELQESDVQGYINNMSLAYDEYTSIIP